MDNFTLSLLQSVAKIFDITTPDNWLDWLVALGSSQFSWEFILQIVLVFALLLLGRYIYDLVTPFSLAEVLTTRDNKALSCSFACYLSGLSIVLVGVYSSPSLPLPFDLDSQLASYLLYSLSNTFFWGAISICLLLLAQVLNNHLILSHFDNYSQIIEHRNIAAGITEGASYIFSAVMIYAVMQGVNDNFLLDIVLTLFYFILGQLILILYSRFFIAVRRKWWDFHSEIGKQNTAAAISFAFSMTSFAILIASYITHFYSIYGLLLVAVLGMSLMQLLHILIDKLFFPKAPLQLEISADQNWGATLIEGFLLLGFCVCFVVAFSFYLT